mgnify:CR=1 FL=1
MCPNLKGTNKTEEVTPMNDRKKQMEAVQHILDIYLVHPTIMLTTGMYLQALKR